MTGLVDEGKGVYLACKAFRTLPYKVFIKKLIKYEQVEQTVR